MNWLKRIWKALSEPVPHVKTPSSASRDSANTESFLPSLAEDTPGNYTPRAQQVLALARKEANRLNHNFVGTEHLLLGLIALGQGVGCDVLQRLGLDLEMVRAKVEKQIGTGPDKKLAVTPFTPRAMRVLATAEKERRDLSHTYLGTEHILLGLLAEGEGVAARILNLLEVDIVVVRQEILKELDPNYQPGPPEADQTSTPVQAPSSPNQFSTTVSTPQQDAIDLNQRYDVYCSERHEHVVVHRNVLFKGAKRLFREDRDNLAEFYELEQADGQQVFVAKYSVVKFCKHGSPPSAEDIPGKQP